MMRLCRSDDVHLNRAAAAVIDDDDVCGLDRIQFNEHTLPLIIGFDLAQREISSFRF